MASQKSFRSNGEVRGNPSGRTGNQTGDTQTTTGDRTSHVDIKLLQQKAQLAEIKRTQQEVELRENHPFFDRPLFVLGRENRFRQLCLILVEARHKAHDALDSTDNGSFIHSKDGMSNARKEDRGDEDTLPSAATTTTTDATHHEVISSTFLDSTILTTGRHRRV
ncbi:unnamed protein product [Trichobilharzia regenti]|nr:unnamed protein product [Trichobilharzia regenti]